MNARAQDLFGAGGIGIGELGFGEVCLHGWVPNSEGDLSKQGLLF
jgi:hypothetical protein